MKTWTTETWVSRRLEAQINTGLPDEEGLR
jgi:hypothetical protein